VSTKRYACFARSTSTAATPLAGVECWPALTFIILVQAPSCKPRRDEYY
jgi:hypothetical protein